MRAIPISLSTLLIVAGLLGPAAARAATTQGDPAASTPAATNMLPDAIQLAGSFQNSTAKLADKYLTGRSGGRYGIGGSESVVFKKKKQK
jgi:hypothetical protein